jgi:hypothetical protein
VIEFIVINTSRLASFDIMFRRFVFSITGAHVFWIPTTEGFSPSSPRTHYQQNVARSTSTTRIFDNEQSTMITSSFLQNSAPSDYGVLNPNEGFNLDASDSSAFAMTAAAREFGDSDTKNNSKAKSDSKALESEFPKRKITASVRETGTDSMKYYIKTMCNHELLNKNEEIILAREIQILLKWETEREQLEEKLIRYVFTIVWGCGIV